MVDHSVQHVGDDDTRKNRNQHVAEHNDKDESDHQHEAEDQDLRIGKVAVDPVAYQLKHFLDRRSAIAPLRQLLQGVEFTIS